MLFCNIVVFGPNLCYGLGRNRSVRVIDRFSEPRVSSTRTVIRFRYLTARRVITYLLATSWQKVLASVRLCPWFLSVEIASHHPSGARNFKVDSR